MVNIIPVPSTSEAQANIPFILEWHGKYIKADGIFAEMKNNWVSSYLPGFIGAALMAEEMYKKYSEPDWEFVKNEYDKIQKKQSKLSRRERLIIVNTWEQHLKEGE